MNLYLTIRQNHDYPSINKKDLINFISGLDSELLSQVRDFLDSKDFRLTSRYWRFLMRRNLIDIYNNGIEKYGTSVARDYFTWTDFNEDQIHNLLSNNIDPEIVNIFKVHDGFTRTESIKHNILIAIAYNHLTNSKLLEDFNELQNQGYLFGGHPFHLYKDKAITLDGLISIMEFSTFKNFIKNESLICEIGAGSGRTAEAILTAVPGINYIIADLPPASFLAMHRLRLVFPDFKILYIDNDKKLQIAMENMSDWNVIFCLPHLLENIPNKSIDLLLAVDCLHEMSNKMRKYVSEIATRKCLFFYFKVWEKTFIPLDNLALDAALKSDYFVDSSWEEVLDRPCSFPGNFREFIYRT